jgi:hypothetical protein
MLFQFDTCSIISYKKHILDLCVWACGALPVNIYQNLVYTLLAKLMHINCNCISSGVYAGLVREVHDQRHA